MREYTSHAQIVYFVAFYGDKKAFCYHANDNTWRPYSNIYRQSYADRDTAEAVARHARHKNKGKRKSIFVDSFIKHVRVYA